MILAPTRDIHARAAFVQASCAMGAAEEDVAVRLATDPPRRLLAQALGDVHPRLFRLLDRATLPAWSLAAYRDLDQGLRDGTDDVLPPGAIQPASVKLLAVLHTSDVLRRARHALRDVEMAESLLSVLEALRRIGSGRAVEQIANQCKAAALKRAVRRDIAHLPSPHVYVQAPSGWRVLATLAQVWRIGRTMRHCLQPGWAWDHSERILDFLTGRTFYLHHSEEQVIGELRQSLGGAWFVAELRGPRNRAVSEALRDGLIDGLREQRLLVDAWPGFARAWQRLAELQATSLHLAED
jgi:hypothetical protein